MKELIPLFISICILLVLSILFFIFFPPIQKSIYKRRYLNIYGRKIYKIADKEDYYLINKLTLKTYDEQNINIDHLLCANKYIYVIKDRYFDGGIIAKSDDIKWVYYKKIKKDIVKENIDNPILVNELRLKKLTEITSLDKSLFISIVLINKDCYISDEFKNDRDDSYLVKINKLAKFIKKCEKRDIDNINEVQLKNAVNDLAKLNINKNEK